MEGLQVDGDNHSAMHGRGESFNNSKDNPTTADIDEKDNLEVDLPEPHCSTESGIVDIINKGDEIEVSDAKHNNLDKEVTEVEVVINSENKISSNYCLENDTCLLISKNSDAMDIDEGKFNVTEEGTSVSIKDLDVVQIDNGEKKLDVTNTADNTATASSTSTEDTDIIQTVVVPDNKHSAIVANNKDNLPHSQECLQMDRDNDTVIHDKPESFKSSNDNPTSADIDVEGKSRNDLPEPQCSTESGIVDNTNKGDIIELSDAKHYLDREELTKAGVFVTDFKNRMPTNHCSENDPCLVTSNNNEAMGIAEDMLDVTKENSLISVRYSGILPMDIGDEKVDVINSADNLASTKDANIVQSLQTVRVPAHEILDVCESESKDVQNVDLGNNKSNVVMDNHFVVKPAFELIHEGFLQVDSGRNAVMARREGTPNNDQASSWESLDDCQPHTVVALEENTKPVNIENFKQLGRESICKPIGEVDNSQNMGVTTITDPLLGTDVSHVEAHIEVEVEQVVEMEKGPSKTNDGHFLVDPHTPETVCISDEQQHKDRVEKEEEVVVVVEEDCKKLYSETDMSVEKTVNLYPGFLHPPEKPGKFTVSDLVWGKVRNHPWWPGQIFDPADASEKAVRYYKKGCFLVAYFGDRTFAWNDASLLKPFSSNFSQIVKQSSSETFQNAVRCALEEVSRRIELGLYCSCIPKAFYSNIACQIVENTGIHEESSRKKWGVDKFMAGVEAFVPDKLFLFLKGMACSPDSSFDQLDLVIVRAQLLSYSRFKGSNVLSEFLSGGELLENDDDARPILNNKVFAPSLKRKYRSSKERRMSEINGSSELEGEPDGTMIVYSAKVSPVTPNTQPFKIGERIMRAASHLKGDFVHPEPASSYGHTQNPSCIIELYSQLQMVARAPVRDHTFLDTFVRFMLDLSRYSKKQSKLQQQNLSHSGKPAAVGGARRKRKASQVVGDEGFEFDDDVNDSYWTDMIVQNYSEEQHELLQQQHSVGDSSNNNKSSDHNKTSRRSYSRKRYSIGNDSNYVVAVAADEDVEKKMREPAELILKFEEGSGWLPSEVNLNKIFRRFGPIKELETEVHPECCRGRVVFKRGSDAEVAYSSAEKFSIFGSMHVSYEINYTPVISVRPVLLTTIPQDDAI
ncbi:unnamed protein product [Cuscuta europaea]|uniref:PWWP domain-containing protein n=2 Tax=Cuscuta europaea TaxID=41803 RepID=A0A9P0ZJI1_CUSEU|nr:unnamed protein product [Cuscuta europaea]